IARRVHNDAVRDTLAQRRRRAARWLKLAGTAPRPEYFEIVEPALAGEPDSAPLPRPSARGVLVDPDGRLLLFHGHDPPRAGPGARGGGGRGGSRGGGGVGGGGTRRGAGARGRGEEPGLALAGEARVGRLGGRRVVFSSAARPYEGGGCFSPPPAPAGNGTPL